MGTLALVIAIIGLLQLITAVLLFAFTRFDRVRCMVEIYVITLILYFLFMPIVAALAYSGGSDVLACIYFAGIPIAFSMLHIAAIILHFYLRSKYAATTSIPNADPTV